MMGSAPPKLKGVGGKLRVCRVCCFLKKVQQNGKLEVSETSKFYFEYFNFTERTA